MKIGFATLLLFLATGPLALAGEIREGDTMYVRANSMWFESASTLATWQRDKRRLSPKALKVHQDNLLGGREAWQFITKQPVRIRRYWGTEHEVQVEMLSPGRLHGSVWWVDAEDCVGFI
jgi:hypothetical protein